MILGVSRGINTIKLVKEVHGRGAIRAKLKNLGFRAIRLMDWTNTFTLRRINVEQYEKFLGFMGVIRDYIKENYVVNEGELLPLTLPWPGGLSKVNFEKLLASPEAMNEVMSICVMPEGRSEVDLSSLPHLYKTHVVDKEIPA